MNPQPRRRAVYPADDPVPSGHSPGVMVDGPGRLVFLSGQVGRDRERNIAAGDLVAQVEQSFRNIERILEGAGGTMQSIVSVRSYLTRVEDVPTYRATYERLTRAIWGPGTYPANTLLVLAGLAFPEFLVEIEAVAVVP